MNKNPWNTNTILTLVGLVLFLVGIVAFYFIAGGLPNKPIYLYTTIGIAMIIALVAIIYLVLVAKGKITRSEPDYRQLFMMGLIFLPLGVGSDNHVFLIFSLVFIGVGLANKKKWKKQPKLSELPPGQRKFRIALIVILGLLVLAGFVFWWWFDKEKTSKITSFEECVAAGNPVMESYPRQCRANNQTFVEKIKSQLTWKQALVIARESRECANAGILTDKYIFNPNSRTWWIDLERKPELEKDGCSPVCVVAEETKTVEVNWRCTGLKPSN